MSGWFFQPIPQAESSGTSAALSGTVSLTITPEAPLTVIARATTLLHVVISTMRW